MSAVDVLRQGVEALAPLSERGGSTTSGHWLVARLAFRAALAGDDPARFLRWPVVRSTMSVETEAHPYVGAELAELAADREWAKRWRPALMEDALGAPEPLAALPASSANLVHEAIHLLRFERATGRRVEELAAVVEFGGGYGSLCRLVHRLGFGGRYTIFDLPELGLLQRYFLDGVGLPDVVLTADEDDFAAALAAAGIDGLFVAMWSISETPLEYRERLLGVDEGVGAHLIGYQGGSEGVDNLAWVARHAARRRLRVVLSGPDPISGNRYLFGSR